MPPEPTPDTSTGEWVLIDRRTIDNEQQRIAMIRHYAEALLSVLPGHPLEPDQLRDSLFRRGGQPAGRQDDVELVDIAKGLGCSVGSLVRGAGIDPPEVDELADRPRLAGAFRRQQAGGGMHVPPDLTGRLAPAPPFADGHLVEDFGGQHVVDTGARWPAAAHVVVGIFTDP